MKKRNWLYAGLVGCFMAVSGFGYSCNRGETLLSPTATAFETAELPSDASREEALTAETEAAEQIVVHICGEVRNPGLYQALKGSRYGDLLELAGGPTERAEADALNLARQAEDGERIYVPAQGESLTEANAGTDTSGKVDLNTANAEELQRLPGIGETKAQAILTYRAEQGAFGSVEELKQVPGIKEAVFAKLKQFVYVSGGS